MINKRLGRQEPTVGFTLPYEQSRGREAIDLYEKSGRTAQPWQVLIINDMLALNNDGLWTHARYGYSVPRQNGKNEIIAIREIFGLQNGERILHTAHRTSTSRAAWERLIMILEAAGIHEIKGEVKEGYRSGKSKGQEFIYLSESLGGGKIQFRTRSTTGGLGETYDLLIIDEAQEYQDDHQSALKYTIVSSENPQTLYLGTPPTPYSSGTIFPKFRKKVLMGEMEDAGWAEWSIEDRSDISDVDLWYQTNPSLGYKLTERAIKAELGDDPIDFNIQRLGLWITYNQQSEISRADWDECLVDALPALVGKMNVGIKYASGGEMVSMSIAVKTADGHIFTESIGCKSTKEGYDWITRFIKSAEKGIDRIIVDGASGVQLLQDALRAEKIKAVAPTTAQFVKANSFFVNSIYDHTIQHMGQPSLTHIVTNCQKRIIGSGGFGFKSIIESAEISLLDSAILAVWSISEFKEKTKQRVVY